MARPRTNLGHELEAEIAARIDRGESAETIAQAIGKPKLVSTIGRRMKERKVGAAPASPPPERTPPPVVDVPEIVPEGTPLETMREWQRRVDEAGRAAEARGDLRALAAMAMRAVSIADAIRKATPRPKADPNENPDMLALADIGEQRLLRLVNELFAPTQ